jgi:predicted nucleic acid-binding protein
MNGNNIFAATSLLVNFFNGVEISKKVMRERNIWLSCISEIELLSYPKLSEEEDQLIRSFLQECSVIDLLKPIRETTIHIRREKKLKVPDAIIAATSIYLGIPLVTMDSDFKNLNQLDAVIFEL